MAAQRMSTAIFACLKETKTYISKSVQLRAKKQNRNISFLKLNLKKIERGSPENDNGSMNQS